MKRAAEHQTDDKSSDRRINRRNFIWRLGALPVAMGAGSRAAAVEFQKPPVTSANSPNSRAFDFTSLATWITPTSQFFIRSHFGVPEIDRSRWAVNISGAVENRRTVMMDELLQLPHLEQAVTLECAGNLVGWGGVSNARWAGVGLAALLKSARVLQGATEVVLVGADGGTEREAGGIQVEAYARSIPLAKAMDPATMLVFRMNGERLSAEHGGPLRAIIPGLYGMDSVKWVKQIIVVREPFGGFYQSRRYYEARRINGQVVRGPLGPVRLKSQIARPINNETLGAGQIQIVGAAWCGDADIAAVELSFDGGRTWKEARLGADSAPFAWRLWSYDWAAARGAYEIIARARDARGRTQPLERDESIITPYANNWADRRKIVVGL